MSHQISAIGYQIRSRRGALVVAALAVAMALPFANPSSYGMILLNQALIFVVVVMGLNFIYGFGGIFSLAQAAFWGIGAYTSALATTDGHLPFLAGLLLAGLVAAIFGVLVGLPTLKLRSHYLTMATLGFAESVRVILMNAEGLTHGAQGIRGIPPASLGPLVFEDPLGSYYFHLAVVLVLLIFTVRFRASRLGRALEATRDDELAAGATGVNVTHTRVMAFVLSAFLAGIGGSLWAHFSAYISPEAFDLFASIRFVSMLLIGGSGTVLGPVIGAGLLTYLPEWLRFLESWYMAIYGLSIVLILLFAPRGIVGLVTGLVRRAAPSPVAAGFSPRVPAPNYAISPTPDPAPEPSGKSGSSAPGFDQRISVSAGAARGLKPAATENVDPRPVLETRGLTIAFGGLVAVRGLDLSVARGEIRGIIGPNGSGKTTFLNLISGIYRQTAGEIRLKGERVDGLAPSQLVERGIARTFQNLRLFSQMTIRDNVKVASYCRTRSGLGSILLQTRATRSEEREVEEETTRTLEFIGLASRGESLPGDLSYGQRRLVEIARALATGPSLLLLDEPAAGMNPVEKGQLVRLIQAIHEEREIAIIIIEHDMKVISGLCHRVTVLNQGETIAEGTPEEVREDPAVIEAYLGRGRRKSRAAVR